MSGSTYIDLPPISIFFSAEKEIELRFPWWVTTSWMSIVTSSLTHTSIWKQTRDVLQNAVDYSQRCKSLCNCGRAAFIANPQCQVISYGCPDKDASRAAREMQRVVMWPRRESFEKYLHIFENLKAVIGYGKVDEKFPDPDCVFLPSIWTFVQKEASTAAPPNAAARSVGSTWPPLKSVSCCFVSSFLRKTGVKTVHAPLAWQQCPEKMQHRQPSRDFTQARHCTPAEQNPLGV